MKNLFLLLGFVFFGTGLAQTWTDAEMLER